MFVVIDCEIVGSTLLGEDEGRPDGTEVGSNVTRVGPTLGVVDGDILGLDVITRRLGLEVGKLVGTTVGAIDGVKLG